MQDPPENKELPEIVQQYIKRLARRVHNRHMRRDVLAELRAHFADILADAPQDQDPHEQAQSLVAEFGDVKLLGKLIKRAKKRCYPMWVKVIGYACRTIIIAFVILVCYSIWFVRGKPTISVDYLAKFNEMSRPAADKSLNAGPHYLRASELFVPTTEVLTGLLRPSEGPGSTPTAEKRRLLNKWISENRPAVEELRLGATKPHCWFEYNTGVGDGQPGMIDLLIPKVGNIRNIGLVLCWRIQFSAEQGLWDSVNTDLQSLKKVAEHLMERPTLIEQLAGMGVDLWASQQLIYVLRNHSFPSESLDALAGTLSDSFTSGYPIADVSFKTLGLLDTVQRLFTDDGSGDGHFIPSAARRFLPISTLTTYSTHGYYLADMADPHFLMRAMIHPSRRETVEIILQWQEKSDLYRSRTPYQNHVSGQSVDAWFLKIIEENPRNLFIKHRLPSLQRAVVMSYVGQTKHEADQATVALLRYKAEHGRFPEKLNQLTPRYLQAVPQDPFGPGPLSYKRQGHDFIIYSWGWNFEDHGGQHNRDVFRMRNQEGDYVFWPPQTIDTEKDARRRIAQTRAQRRRKSRRKR